MTTQYINTTGGPYTNSLLEQAIAAVVAARGEPSAVVTTPFLFFKTWSRSAHLKDLFDLNIKANPDIPEGEIHVLDKNARVLARLTNVT